MEIINEKTSWRCAQFGGQTAINPAGPMAKRGVKFYFVDGIDMAEDRG